MSMSAALCSLWPYVCGALIGWLLAGVLAHLLAEAPPTVERIVERIVERPVHKMFDNPAHLDRIRTLEAETEAATVHVRQLRTELLQLQSAPPRVVERVVEKIVDRVLEIPVPDEQALAAKDLELASLRGRLALADSELSRLRTGAGSP
jgi:hypothetical protein